MQYVYIGVVFIFAISLLISVVSIFKMHSYLYERGQERFKSFSFNPLIQLKYKEVCKKEIGKDGPLFRINVISFVIAMCCLGVIIIFKIFGNV